MNLLRRGSGPLQFCFLAACFLQTLSIVKELLYKDIGEYRYIRIFE